MSPEEIKKACETVFKALPSNLAEAKRAYVSAYIQPEYGTEKHNRRVHAALAMRELYAGNVKKAAYYAKQL